MKNPLKGGSGRLYVVSTPIGNLEDITDRAKRVLAQVDLVAAEDTRLTGRMLAGYGIDKPLISYYEHNEAERIPSLLDRLSSGLSIAVVTDAGTPCISDPGYRLVKAAADQGITVVPVPGPSGIIAALSASGLPSDRFLFLGFLPKKSGKRKEKLTTVTAEPGTLIFYESPRRITACLRDAREILGNRTGVLCREMTKRHEEFIRGRLSDLLDDLQGRSSIRGECTLLIQGCDAPEPSPWEQVEAEIDEALTDSAESLSAVSKRLAKKHGFPKQRIYEEALKRRSGKKPV